MLQLLVVHKQARIDDEGSLWVLCNSHVGVNLIGLERIPNLYEREKHSLYDPGKEKTLSIKVIVISINVYQEIC